MKNLLFIDFETYYDSEFSLRKMPTPNYILDPRYETILVAVKANDGEHEIIDGPDFPKWLKQFDPAETTTVTYNALFDCSILAWRYGFVPHTMIDAMGMARALLGHELARFSLESVANHLELGAKGTALKNMLGKRRAQIKSEGLWSEFCDYALKDNILCEGIFRRLAGQFPKSEIRVMDLVLRCCVEPRFICDTPLLRDHLEAVKAEKAKLLNRCSVDQIALMSAAKFKTALEQNGVIVEMKPGAPAKDGTERLIPALAKTDPFMAGLLEHANPKVQALAAARLGLKSTLEETRTAKLLSIAELNWSPGHRATSMPVNRPLCAALSIPVPLAYGKTHTHRLSGEWGMNMQNLPADRNKDGKSKLRASLRAPAGHKIIVADLGQIECRLSGWLCKAETLLKQFADDTDPYAALAQAIFKKEIAKDSVERFIGKTGILGLGYGAGKAKFDVMVTTLARTMGLDISAIYDKEIGDKAVDTYRELHKEIPNGWRDLDNKLVESWLKGNDMTFGPGEVIKLHKGTVVLPNGLELRYGEPKRTVTIKGDRKKVELSYEYGKVRHHIYGAKFLENITQALARVVVMDAAVRLYRRHKLRFVLQAHDELVFIVPEELVDESRRIIQEEMTRAPKWASDLPLKASVNHGETYAESK